MDRLSEAQKSSIIRILSERLAVFTIILFGSAAKEALRQDSDIDISFMNDFPSSTYDVFLVAQELADLLKREVDLVDFRQASTVLQAQIVANGIMLLDDKQTDRQYAFMRSLKSYALLNEERSQIIQKKIFFERSV
jgi:predicted nucleotidyltransferase